MELSGNTIFIAGATGGIGRALALEFHRRGNTVIAGGRRRDALDELSSAHPGIETVDIDTASSESIRTAAATILNRHPELNVLIAMAGIMRIEDWRRPADFLQSAEDVVTVDLLGPIRLIGAFVEHLQTRPDATIMTVSSGLGFVPLRVTPSYNAAKAGVHMLTESLRLQLADTSVGLVELIPPAVRTSLLPGQESSDFAMPLDEFVAEVFGIVERDPSVAEINVDRVKFLRCATARDSYVDAVQTLNSSDPHARNP